jgi:hypothetical protein
VFIGCLTYKPQWGILVPVALIAAKKWRAVVSSIATTAILAGISIIAFGVAAWSALPRELLARAAVNLSLDPGGGHLGLDPRGQWRYHQTIFGLIHSLHGTAFTAWLAQGVATLGCGIIVWLVWRFPARYALQAATLSAAVLVAAPHAFGYDMVAIAIPVAFLSHDQIRCGLLRGEQTWLLSLFGATMLCNLGPVPVGPFVAIVLLGLVLRRAYLSGPPAEAFA